MGRFIEIGDKVLIDKESVAWVELGEYSVVVGFKSLHTMNINCGSSEGARVLYDKLRRELYGGE